MFGDPVRNERGWDTTEITEICEEIVDCVNKTAPQVEEKTTFVMVRTSNIRDGRISLDKVKYVDAETYKVWTRRSKPRIGDILFTREAPMGEAGLIDFKDQIFLGQRIVQYRCNLKVANPKFILELMKTRFFQRQVDKLGKGSTVKHLAVPDCFKFMLSPPLYRLKTNLPLSLRKSKTSSPTTSKASPIWKPFTVR
jgi:type I restriction enzyme S subunit